MRLLTYRTTGSATAPRFTFSFVERNAQDLPFYAILSHRWGPDEVLFKEIEDDTAWTKVGGCRKLEFCAERAIHDGLQYFWVDTCCINKDSSAELSTALNSMFKWYQNATKCYVYLPDVPAGPSWLSAFQRSEWFDRGWTLQELIAPTVVEFFSVEKERLGDKASLEQQISQASGVPIDVLRGKPLSQVEESERFSWTARRKTTIEEDAVYCLFGIFDVHMPLLYGEGEQKALLRLQREIQFAANLGLEQRIVEHALWSVPLERNPLFTGRDDQLAELEGKLLGTDHSTSKVAITGLGGIGKTQLILEFLHRFKTKHPACSIMWIVATTVASLQQGYLRLAQQLKIPGHENQNADVKQLVRQHLSKDEAGQWLLVFDNADDIDMWTTAQPILQGEHGDGSGQRLPTIGRRLIDYLPKSRQGCIMFTTRNRKVAVKLARQNIVTVPEMSEEVAIELLKKSLTDVDLVDDIENTSTLLAALTSLPLAIAQAAAYINANGITLVDYISLLHEKEEDVIDILSEDFEDDGRYHDVKNPVATTWLISFEQIRRSDPLAAEYLSFIACISPKAIPQSLLPPGLSRKKELDAIGTLAAYSLVTWRSIDATLDVHRLVHLVTRNWLRRKDTLDEWIERSIMHLDKVFPDNNHRNRSTWTLYLPHALYILACNLVIEGKEYGTALMRKCGACLYRDGRWNEAEIMFIEVLSADTRTFGEKALETLTSMHNLASTYRKQGRWEKAEQLSIQVMETSKTKLGLDHLDTLTSIASLASIYRKQGRWEKAEQLYIQVMETSKTKLGPDHPDTITSIASLALIYTKQGRWKEAEQLQTRVVETSKTKLGPDHPHTLTGIHNLAITYWTQGRWEEAEQLQVQVIEASKKLGPDHPDMLASVASLAATYRKQGRWKEAEQLQVQVMGTRKTKLGPDHPDTLTSMDNLAYTWKDMGQHNKAMRLMQDCVRQRARILGDKHPDSLSSVAKLREWQAEHTSATTSAETDGMNI